MTPEQLKLALAAYNKIWENSGAIDAENVEEIRELAMSAALRALPAKALSTLPQPETMEHAVDISGWKLVPDQPTEGMWQAGRSADLHLGDSYSKVWSAMFEAAPNVDDCETTSAPKFPALDVATVDACIEAISDVVQKRDDLGYIHFAELTHAIRALLAQPHTCNASEAVLPKELRDELIGLERIVHDNRCSNDVIGMRIRNTWDIYRRAINASPSNPQEAHDDSGTPPVSSNHQISAGK